MKKSPVIRESELADVQALKALYGAAFSEEDLFPLVLELLGDAQNTLCFSAFRADVLMAHVALTRCRASPTEAKLALLGPLAVLPSYQREGVGSRLIEHSLDALEREGVAKVLVLGDPTYYGRFGFCEEEHILPTFPIPPEWKPAWQSIALTDDSSGVAGRLEISRPWQRRELWSP